MDLIRTGALAPGEEIKLLGSEEFSHVADHLAWAKKWKPRTRGLLEDSRTGCAGS